MRRHDRRRFLRFLSGGALALLVVLLAGCGKRGWLETYPVKGTVLVGGKAAPGATVSFHPKEMQGDKPYLPTGQTDENGEFTLATFVSGDGAPAGEYDVTIIWPVRYNPISTLWEGDKLDGRYADKAKSTLHVTVEKKPQQLPPFELIAGKK
jgi:hypothetical protein